MKALDVYGKTILAAAGVLMFSFNLAAQTGNPPVKIEKTSQAENKPVAVETPKIEAKTVETPKPTDAPASPEEAEILPFYNNYLNEYRLGPNDVITIEVFGQCPDYCKTGITVPPTARISYPLIREGVMVGGKTVEQIGDEITKKLDEYIIEPKVTVTLDKAMSARYSVLGKVAAPGVRVLDRKVSVYEAIAESGGVTKEGDKKRIVVYSYDQAGRIKPRTVNLQEIERGRGEMIYLNPGDQVFVPDQGFKLNVNSILKVLEKASIVRLLFGSPF